MSQTKAIKAGNQLIHQTIYNQAGSIEKAILEYIMNSVDAKATEIRINIHDNGIQYSILDNGDGFGDPDYTYEQKEMCIDEVFGYLGFDHGTEDENQRTYGKFGIGRAQLWAFSKNSWHTHDMTMDVDIKNKGLSYDIKQVKDFVNGCKINGEFYEKLKLNEILLIKNELKRLAAYAPIDVYFNDEIINKNMDSLKDHLGVEGVIANLRPTGSIRVYNQGVFVTEISNYVFGTGGTICSEIGYPFEVNAARNDILQSKCKLWKKLKIALNEKLNSELNVKKERVTDELRLSLLSRVAIGDYGEDNEYISKSLIKMANNKYTSIDNLISSDTAFSICTKRGSQIAENLHNSKVAIILLSDFTTALAQDDADFISILKEVCKSYQYGYFRENAKKLGKRFKSYDVLAKENKSDKIIIPNNKLTKKQKIFIESINLASVNGKLAERGLSRRIVLGKSTNASAWTDGQTYIAIKAEELEKIERNAGEIMHLLHLIVHEYTHDDDNTDLHDFNFYKNFHNKTIGGTDEFYFSFINFLKAYTSRLIKNDYVIPKKLARSLNFFNEMVEEC